MEERAPTDELLSPRRNEVDWGMQRGGGTPSTSEGKSTRQNEGRLCIALLYKNISYKLYTGQSAINYAKYIAILLPESH